MPSSHRCTWTPAKFLFSKDSVGYFRYLDRELGSRGRTIWAQGSNDFLLSDSQCVISLKYTYPSFMMTRLLSVVLCLAQLTRAFLSAVSQSCNLCCQVLVGEWHYINRVMQCHSRSLIPVKIIVEELCHFYMKQMRAMSRQVMSYYEKLTKKRCNYRNLVHREERWIFFIRFDSVKVWKLFTQVLFLTSSNRRTCKQSARWSNLDLAKCRFCSSRIWLFALSIVIDNYNQCYCCRNGQSRIGSFFLKPIWLVFHTQIFNPGSWIRHFFWHILHVCTKPWRSCFTVQLEHRQWQWSSERQSSSVAKPHSATTEPISGSPLEELKSVIAIRPS